MLLNPDQKLAFLYFENLAEVPEVTQLLPNQEYQSSWFDPIAGEWLDKPFSTKTDNNGAFVIEAFPDGQATSNRDWALKIKQM